MRRIFQMLPFPQTSNSIYFWAIFTNSKASASFRPPQRLIDVYLSEAVQLYCQKMEISGIPMEAKIVVIDYEKAIFSTNATDFSTWTRKGCFFFILQEVSTEKFSRSERLKNTEKVKW